jgi:hypothetical protein
VGHSQTGKEGTKGSSVSAVGESVMTRSDWWYPKAVARDSITRYVCIHAGGKEDGTRG